MGDVIKADVFQEGELVDVIGTSKGRGFAGVVKRYGFAGGPKTHGQSDRHRTPGSRGAGTTPGHTYPGYVAPVTTVTSKSPYRTSRSPWWTRNVT